MFVVTQGYLSPLVVTQGYDPAGVSTVVADARIVLDADFLDPRWDANFLDPRWDVDFDDPRFDADFFGEE